MSTISPTNGIRLSTCKLDLLGLYGLLSFLILNPFHFILYDKFIYYREVFALFFSVLGCLQFFSYSKRGFARHYPVRIELFFLLFFCFLLIMFAILDPGRNLYGSDNSGASLQLQSMNPVLYVLRNAFIYIPMVVYFAFRGITESGIRKIAFTTVAIAPFSVLTYIYHFKWPQSSFRQRVIFTKPF
jgi:hypothetical protein